jgi:TetR/AcrR family transcriptional repressor of nem operon
VEKLKPILAGMIKAPYCDDPVVINKLAQGIVAMLEGGILLMKSKQDIEVLTNMIDLIKNLVNSYVHADTIGETG